jgi:hypothetical protein
MKATVHTPFYDWDGRKYFELETKSEGLVIPTIQRIKIPWRYGRVMCRIEGLKTVQELQKGDEIEITLEKKVWDGLEHWVLSSIKTE